MTRVQIVVRSPEGDVEVEQEDDDWSSDSEEHRTDRIDSLLYVAAAKVRRAYGIHIEGNES